MEVGLRVLEKSRRVLDDRQVCVGVVTSRIAVVSVGFVGSEVRAGRSSGSCENVSGGSGNGLGLIALDRNPGLAPGANICRA